MCAKNAAVHTRVGAFGILAAGVLIGSSLGTAQAAVRAIDWMNQMNVAVPVTHCRRPMAATAVTTRAQCRVR